MDLSGSRFKPSKQSSQYILSVSIITSDLACSGRPQRHLLQQSVWRLLSKPELLHCFQFVRMLVVLGRERQNFNPQNSIHVYPCFRLGDPVTPIPNPETELTFNIYRHTEDMESNYNVQLDKYDYETGKSLENSIFELYERFDDKDEVNLERDGAVELYKGGDSTCKQSIVI